MVIQCDIENIDVNNIGRNIRNHEKFAPAGTNVNFIQIENKQIKIRTYERGVEGETLACGTGSVAAAIISAIKYELAAPVELMVRSGETLIVNFEKDENTISDVSLTGAAEQVFSGEFYL